jgi:hypothetical protein
MRCYIAGKPSTRYVVGGGKTLDNEARVGLWYGHETPLTVAKEALCVVCWSSARPTTGVQSRILLSRQPRQH